MGKQNFGAIPPPLTIEYLRQSSGMDLTDEEAQNLVDSLNTFARILLIIKPLENTHLFDNQLFVNSSSGGRDNNFPIHISKQKNKAA